MILQTDTHKYYGKRLAQVTDRDGNELSGLVMEESVVFHFDDGSKLCIQPDMRGSDCYISQYTTD